MRTPLTCLTLLLAACTPDPIGVTELLPELAVTPGEVVFGQRPVPLAAVDGLVVANAGRADLELSFAYAGDDAFVVDTTAVTLAPDEQLPLAVTFTPTTFLDYTGTLTITSNDEDDPEVTVALTGTGVSAPLPDIALSSLSVDFGDEDGIATEVLTVSNVGTAPLHLGDLTQTGSGVFVLLTSPADTTIAPGDELPVVVQYLPTTQDGDTGSLTFASDDPDEPTVEVVLLGNGGSEALYPVAVIDCPGTVDPPAFAQLDAYDSHDPGGNDPLTYAWTLTELPDDGAGNPISAAYLTNAVSDTTRLWADAVGEYEVQLQVTNTLGITSAPARCRIEAIPSEKVHVELTWSTSNADLDLHLARDTAPIFAKPADASWCNRAPAWGSAGPADDPRLDLDDRAGHGPENLNIDDPADGTYDVRVHYFEDQGDDVVTATVRVYLEGALALTASQNLDRNEVWDAARINWPQQTAAQLSNDPYVSPRRQCYTP